jgi:hypothetical protein
VPRDESSSGTDAIASPWPATIMRVSEMALIWRVAPAGRTRVSPSSSLSEWSSRSNETVPARIVQIYIQRDTQG